MFPIPNHTYAQWRLNSGAGALLRDEHDFPPEKLLQAVWQHQRLLREDLQTLTGQRVRILHPGFLSREGGPDFRGAVVRFDNDPPRSGDIEVDLHANGWRAHGHDKNPAFANVILHVIWAGEKSIAGAPPGVRIDRQLDAPIGELCFWLDSAAADSLPGHLRGQCSSPLRNMPPENLTRLLCEAADVRFCAKAAHFQARARQSGWEQSLWEGIFRALGYKNNTWPMQCLAEQREL